MSDLDEYKVGECRCSLKRLSLIQILWKHILQTEANPNETRLLVIVMRARTQVRCQLAGK